MTNGLSSPELTVKRLLKACLEERNLSKTLLFLTEDIKWISAGSFETTCGIEETLQLLEHDFSHNIVFSLEFQDVKAEYLQDSQTLVIGNFLNTLSKKGACDVTLPFHFSALCKKEDDGYRISLLHLSISADALYQPPLSGVEPHTLRLLNSSIAGGMLGGYMEEGFPLYFINAPMLLYLGYTYPQFVEATQGLIINCIHPQDREAVERDVSQALKHSDEYEVTYRMQKRDGSYIWVLNRGRKTKTPQEKPVIVSVCTDITASVTMQKELEEKSKTLMRQNKQLEKSQERFQFIIENISGGLAEFSVEPYRLLYLSESMYGLIGYTREEFEKTGRTLSSVYHPDDLEAVKASIEEQLTAGGNLYLEYRVIKKNNAVCWVQMKGNRIVCEDGTEHIIVLYNDITKLKISQLELSSLTNTIPGGVIKIDIESMRIVYANDFFYEMNGYPRENYEALIQSNAFALIHPEDRQRIYDTLAHGNGNRAIALEYRFQMLDKTWSWRIMTGKVYRDSDGKKMALCMIIDHTDQKKLELSLRMEKEQYRIVTELSGSTLWSYQFDQGSALPELGLQEIHKNDLQKLKKFFNRCRLGGENLKLEFRARGKTGESYQWYRIEAALLRDHHDHVIKAIGKLTNIQQEKQQNMELRHATQHDGMTGLYNKTYMREAVDDTLSKQKYAQDAAFLIIDVDNFKQVNDQLGHLFGDTVLVNIAGAIRNSIPDSAMAGRVGGDEFVVLLPGTKRTEAMRIAEIICTKIRGVYAGELKETQISCSIGGAIAPKQGKDYLTLFRNADEALYNAKKAGKNRALFYNNKNKQPSSGGALFNQYQMDDDPIPVSPDTQDTQEFLSWVTRLLSSTKDLDSAIQLVLDKFCINYAVDHVFIVERTPLERQIEITYLRSRDNKPFFLKRYDVFHCPDAADDEPFYRCETEEELAEVFLSSLPVPQQKRWQEKSIVSLGFFNDQKFVGCLWAVKDHAGHVWGKKEAAMLHEIRAVLTPYLIKKQIANESAYQVERALHYDKLTGLPLLTRFKTDAQRFLDNAAQGRYAIICSDINNFKYINDTYGFAAGDEVLCAFAAVLHNSRRKRSVCTARITNDKFIALVPFLDFEELKDHIGQIHDEIRLELHGKLPEITLFINSGICEFLPGENSITRTIDNANSARKSGKGKAQDTCRVYDDDLEQRLSIENDMACHMHEALEQGEFEVYLQPKVCTFDGTLIGAEALIRWNRPGGMIYPNDFIPFFEKNGFITRLDEFVLIEVLKTEQRWLQTFHRSIPVSINLSRLHGDNPDKVREILELTQKYQVPPSCIEFELTETALYDDGQRLSRLMEKLIENGYSVSIDDFGSGYSSLNAIASLPANIIKLDKGFLRKDEENAHNRIVVKHIIAMAKEMGFSIICEGVETEKQVAFLRAMDCEMAQGYYFAKPMPIAKFEETYFR